MSCSFRMGFALERHRTGIDQTVYRQRRVLLCVWVVYGRLEWAIARDDVATWRAVLLVRSASRYIRLTMQITGMISFWSSVPTNLCHAR